MDRYADLLRFYAILSALEVRLGGKRSLADCDGRMAWPERGLYFLFEPGELRSDTGTGSRVVRVGTHALKAGSRTSLWQRLSQHRGVAGTGGGNHRGSIFRLLVGAAIKNRDVVADPCSWGVAGDLGTAARSLGLTREQVRIAERPLEASVSAHIRRMPFVWLAIDDVAGPASDRGLIERNAIALLSNSGRPALDAPSGRWLGSHSDRERVRKSGLWNNNHVDETYDPRFLTTMETWVARIS